jgi:AcrR family transcriptional regulator
MNHDEERTAAMTKREKILIAAGLVFSTKGFYRATMDEIAREASVAKGTLYYNFPSKAKLFAATVTEGMEEIIGQVEQELESDLPFREHLRHLIRSNFLLYLKYSDLSKIVFNEITSGIDDEVLDEIEKVRVRYIDFIADLLREGQTRGYLKEIDTRLAAVGLVGFLDNLCNYYLKNEKMLDREELIDIMFTVLSAGLLAERG